MSTVKELMLSPAGTVAAAGLDELAAADVEDAALVAGAVLVVEEDDEQPAAIRATTAAAATQPNRGLNVPSAREGTPPRLLLPSSIPYPFRYNAVGYADTGHRKARVPLPHES
jgi:hypothetical protein